MEVSKSQKSVERTEIQTETNMGCSKQGRPMVGPEGQHPVAVPETEGTSYIRPLPSSDGETAEGRYPLSGEHDGHQDRVECGTDSSRHVDLVRIW